MKSLRELLGWGRRHDRYSDDAPSRGSLPRNSLSRKSLSRDRLPSGTTYEEMAVARIAELTESRRSIAQAYEVERRRIENDLHDGAQQYFVAAALKLGEAELEAMDTGNDELMSLIAETRARLEEGLTALRRTVHGIHPQVLRDRGLAAALEEVAEGYGPHVTVQCPHPLPTIDPNVLAAAYFFATESLTNAAKHAPDAPVSVLLTSDDRLHISVMDQGPGGAKVVRGHGISGMTERLAAFDGEVTIDSPVGGPTRIAAKIPLLLNRGESGIADGAGGRDDTDCATTGSATPLTPGESQ